MLKKETVKQLVGIVSEAKTEDDELRSTLTDVQKVNSELKEELLDLKSRSYLQEHSRARKKC